MPRQERSEDGVARFFGHGPQNENRELVTEFPVFPTAFSARRDDVCRAPPTVRTARAVCDLLVFPRWTLASYRLHTFFVTLIATNCKRNLAGFKFRPFGNRIPFMNDPR